MKNYPTNKSILAVDPAANCGWACWNHKTKQVISGTWRLPKISSTHPDAQLDALYRMVVKVVKENGVDQVVYEQAAISKNNRAVAAHYEKIAILKFICVRAGIKCGPGYWISQIKKHATGNGHADKADVVTAAIRLLDRRPADDNEADALWILDMACQGVGLAKKDRSKPPKKHVDLPGQLSLFGQKPRRVVRPKD